MLYCFQKDSECIYHAIDTFDGIVYYYYKSELLRLYHKGIKIEGIKYSKNRKKGSIDLELKTNMGFHDNLPDWQKLIINSNPSLREGVSVEDFTRYFISRLRSLENLAKLSYSTNPCLYGSKGVLLDGYFDIEIIVRQKQSGLWAVNLKYGKYDISEVVYDFYHPSAKRDFNLRNIITMYKMLISGEADDWLSSPRDCLIPIREHFSNI